MPFEPQFLFKVKLGAGGLTGSGGLVDDPDSGMLEMIPPSVKERLLRLQHENKKLKASAGASPSADGDKSKAVLQVQKHLYLFCIFE